MAIDYGAMRAQGRSIGRAHGRASAEIEKERQRQQRKAEMEKRFRQLADEQAKQQNEIAKSQYAQAQAGRLQEEQLIAAAVSDGTMLEDGTYTQKHWERMAADKFFKQKRSLAEEQHFYQNIDTYTSREASGAKQGFERKYTSGDVDLVNYKRSLAYNEEMRQKASEYEYLEGVHASIDRFGTKVTDVIFGEQPEEAPLQAPEMEQHQRGREFGTNEVFEGTPEFQGDTPKADTQVVRGADGKFHVIDKTTAATTDTGLEFDDPNAGSGKPRLSVKDLKDDVNPELRDKFVNGQKVIRLTKDIVELSGVNTSALSSTIPAKIQNFFGTEWSAVADDKDAQKEFMSSKIESILRADANMEPETRSDISAALGKLDSQKLFLAYAMVRIQRGSGRFTGQELQTTLDAFKSNNLAYAMSAVNHAYKEAQMGVKKDVKNMAAEATVTHLLRNGGSEEKSRSQVLSAFDSEPKQDKKGNWIIRVRPSDVPEYGARFIRVSPEGGIDYIK